MRYFKMVRQAFQNGHFSNGASGMDTSRLVVMISAEILITSYVQSFQNERMPESSHL